MNRNHQARRILLTGYTGQVGWELQRTLATLGEVAAVGRDTKPYAMDFAQPETIRETVRQIRPTVIVNAAAYTAVDKAEEDRDLAYAINATAPGVLAEEAKRLDGLLVHYSTDYVFDGSKATPYTEDDPPSPINIYGHSKLAGEQAIQQVGGKYLILRTSWVYGARGKNFLLTMLRLARERDELRIVNDQYGAPTWSRMIAEASAQILAQCLSPLNPNPTFLTQRSGIYHLTCAGEASWFDFAQAIIDRSGNPSSSKMILKKQPKVVPITTDQYPTPAKRPQYSTLANAKVAEEFGIALPSWSLALDMCLDELCKSPEPNLMR